MNRVRAVALGATAALVAVPLSMLPTLPGYATPLSTLTLTSTSGVPGGTVRLAGRIRPGVEHPVKLQRYDGGKYITIATKNTDNTGRFRFETDLPGDREQVGYRVFSPKTLDPETGEKTAYVSPERITVIGFTSRLAHGNGRSVDPAISGDGRIVAFSSAASDLVPTDSNGKADVFVVDRDTGTTTRITDRDASSREAAISAHGRYVTYSSAGSDPDDTTRSSDVFVWDRITGITQRVSHGNAGSDHPAISDDGRYITFSSYASDLVPGDTNDAVDLFVWDQTTGTTTRITERGADAFHPDISGDGRYVTYSSSDSHLVPKDSNKKADVFIWDRGTGTTIRITNGNENATDPQISRTGRRVTFSSPASNLVPNDTNGTADVFIWDSNTGTTRRITNGNKDSLTPVISADGVHITYTSHASNLVPDDTNGTADVFRWDHGTGNTTRLTSGIDQVSSAPAISANGKAITYRSAHHKLGNRVNNSDVFVWDY